MKKLLLLSIISSPLYAATQIQMEGKIAEYPIGLNIEIGENGVVEGNYFYTHYKKPISLKGDLSNRTISLHTIGNAGGEELFSGVVNYDKTSGEVTSMRGEWKKNNTTLSFIAFLEDPLADKHITCNEIEQLPEYTLYEADYDLGSGHAAPIDVDYHCPGSLASLGFMSPLLMMSDSVRGNSKCDGSIQYAYWRGYHHALTRLGYLFEDKYWANKRIGNSKESYFENWSFESLYNREIYKKYKRIEEEVKPKLAAWYANEHGMTKEKAASFAQLALDVISNWGYGYYEYNWTPDILPEEFMVEFRNKNYQRAVEQIPGDASDEILTNALNRLLIESAPKDVVTGILKRIKNPREITGRESPISRAVLNSENVMMLVGNGFNVRHKNYFGKTPLYYAIDHNMHESVQLLLKAGANINDEYKKPSGLFCSDIEHWGRTPLMHAAQHADKRMIEILLAYGADINAKDDLGENVVDYAKQAGNREIAEYFTGIIQPAETISVSPVLQNATQNIEQLPPSRDEASITQNSSSRVKTETLKLEAPVMAENGNVVPVTLKPEFPLQPGDVLVLYAGGEQALELRTTSHPISVVSTRVRLGDGDLYAEVRRVNGEVESGRKKVDITIPASTPEDKGNSGTTYKIRVRGNTIKMLIKNDMAMMGYIREIVLTSSTGKITAQLSLHMSKNPYFSVTTTDTFGPVNVELLQ